MSTQANVKIKEYHKIEIELYRHSDGYPECCGADIKEAIKANGWADPEYFSAHLIRQSKNLCFVPAICVHGDEEYFWLIDFDRKELSYKHSENGEKVIYYSQEMEEE